MGYVELGHFKCFVPHSHVAPLGSVKKGRALHLETVTFQTMLLVFDDAPGYLIHICTFSLTPLRDVAFVFGREEI